MTDRPIPDTREAESLDRAIASKAARKLRVRHRGDRSVWFGLGMIGLIGWTVALPSVLGALIGMWLDKHHPRSHSWALALLVAGLTLGCVQAYRWMSREEKKIREEEADR